MKTGTVILLVVFTIVVMLAILVTVLTRPSGSEIQPYEDEAAEDDRGTGEVERQELDGGDVKVIIDNRAASKLVAEKLKGNAPVKDVMISFYEPNGMSVDGVAVTGELENYIPSDLPTATKIALGLLPDECEFTADISLFSDGKGGLTAEVNSIGIGALSLSPSLLPEGFSEGISRALTEGLREQGISIERIKITDGLLEAEGKPIESEG